MTKIFVDTADIEWIEQHDSDPLIEGYTTNPTLLRQSDAINYEYAIRQILEVTSKPVSFEVLANDATNIRRQAQKLVDLGSNVYVKVPAITADGASLVPVIHQLSLDGISVNATAVFSESQINDIASALATNTPSIMSIFAGRIADTGRDPSDYIRYGKSKSGGNTKVLWASARGIYDYYWAVEADCDVITLPPSLFYKLSLVGKPLEECSIDTVRQFDNDAHLAGFTL